MVNAVGLPLQPVVFVPVEPIAPVDTATAETVAERPLPQPAPNPAAQAVVQAKAQAAARQGGLGPLMADLAAMAEAPDSPPALKQAIGKVLGLQTELSPGLPPQALKQAVAQSGLFLEARLASAPQQPPGPDLKAALLVLRQVLGETAGAASAAAPGRAPAAPPPPYRGGPTRGQKPVPAALSQGGGLRTAAAQLQQETEAALARDELFQMASLPEPREGAAARWMFEVPFATPQGPAVAHFEISRDGQGAGSAEAEPPIWRTRFSLDVEPLGPVHAALSLAQAGLSVSLWAERTETAQRLQVTGETLVSRLRAVGHEAEVAIRHGAPPHAPPASGRLVDQAT